MDRFRKAGQDRIEPGYGAVAWMKRQAARLARRMARAELRERFIRWR